MTPQFPNLSEPQAAVASIGSTPTLSLDELRESDKAEVLKFLRERPLHTVVMSGFIRDNGVENWLNRGTFYGCRNNLDELEGVALIGHAMFLEARSDNALRAFAQVARRVGSTHMIMGEQEKVRRLWNFYAPGAQEARLVSRETLLVQTSPADIFSPVPELRLAGLDDLSATVPVHAAMALAESGVDPLTVDPHGFSSRCARRIRQNRTWVWIKDGQLIFKADVVSDTPEAIYIEGIYVAPSERGRGIGSRCMSQVVRNLLQRTKAIVLLVNEKHEAAQSFFRKIGFREDGSYETIFLDGKRS